MEISGKLVPQFMSLAQTMKFIPVSLDIPDDDDTEYKKWLSDNYGDDFYEGDEEDEEEFSRLVTSADDEITLTKAQSRKLNLLRFRLGDEFGERAFLRWQANGQDAEYEDLIAHLNEWSWEEHQQIKEMQADYDIEDHVNDIKKLKLLLEDDSLGVDLEFGEYVDSYVMARVDEEYVELRQDKNGYLSKEIAGNMFLSDLEVAFDRFSLYGLSGPFDYEIIIEGHKKPLSGQEFLDEIL